MKCYIVLKWNGESYEDSEDNAVVVFIHKEDAEKYVEENDSSGGWLTIEESELK